MNKQIAERMSKARTRLLLDAPFFGALALRPKYVERNDIPTWATDGRTIFYNAEFTAKLSDAEIRFILAHEIMHITNGHCWRRDARQPKLWNIAADYQINQILQETPATSFGIFKMPSGGLLDATLGKLGTEEAYVKLLEKQNEQQQQSNKSRQNKGGDSSSQAVESGAQGGAGSGEQCDNDGDGAPSPSGQTNGNSGSASQGGGRGPSPSATGSDGASSGRFTGDFGGVLDAPADSSRQLEEEWKAATINAARCVRGEKPAWMQRMIKELTCPKVDWASVIERFVSDKCKDDYSWARPNQQYMSRGIYMPSLYSEKIGPLVFAIDTSGSVDDKLLTEFMSEVNHVFNQYKPSHIDVLYCDAQVTHHDRFNEGEIVTCNPKGGGGTDFRPVFKWVEENLSEPPIGIVYLTDMCGTFPEERPSVDTLWVSWSDIDSAPFGEVVNVK